MDRRRRRQPLPLSELSDAAVAMATSASDTLAPRSARTPKANAVTAAPVPTTSSVPAVARIVSGEALDVAAVVDRSDHLPPGQRRKRANADKSVPPVRHLTIVGRARQVLDAIPATVVRFCGRYDRVSC